MRWLITGADGFVAKHLIPFLLDADADDRVWAMVWSKAQQYSLPSPHPRLQILAAEITDSEDVDTVVRRSKPDAVLHLASASSVAASWQDPTTAYQVNVLGQLHLLESLLRLQTPPIVVVASSSEVYGRVGHSGNAITESTPLSPASPYAVTKATQDLQAAQYHVSHDLPTIRLRLFNHTGPGRPAHFVVSSFARQIAEIEAGIRKPTVIVGNLEVSRDFSDVRDVVRAWRLAAVTGVAGTAYNICSGRPTSIRWILDNLLSRTSQAIRIEVDPGLLRNGEIEVLYGDPGLFERHTGWKTAIPLEKTLRDLLEWWKNRLADLR